MKKTKENRAITLVALIVTIIILLILAGISVSVLTQTGLFEKAIQAKEKSDDAQKQEQGILKSYEDEIYNYTTNGVWSGEVNRPELMQGMSAIKFTEPTNDTEGTVVDTTNNDTEWYNYSEKKWANAKTEDGSMWVWIPRYAYRIHKENGVETQKFDIVFLIGLTDDYYDENGNIQTAQRQTSEEQTIVTNGDTYTVHPAFTNESSINYANGGWDKELSGIWVAKFEAGYASGNNSAPVKGSSVNYSQMKSIVPAAETGTGTTNAATTSRNWLDGEYAIKNGTNYEWKDGKETSIKYPTFQGLTYSMSYIIHNDAYKISRVLTESGNIYGLNSNLTDSHLIKNSEWGAVAYLSQSKYGLDGIDIVINNINLNSTTKSVYAVTGCAGLTADSNEVKTTIGALNNRTQAEVFVWTQKNGTAASTTGTIYGIYDFSGGSWERTSSIVNNGNGNLTLYGKDVLEDLNNGKSTKYITVYAHDSSKDNTLISNTAANLNTASQANYDMNTKIYGDGIRETSTAGSGNNAWYLDTTYFASLNVPFFIRGGAYSGSSNAGLFYFNRHVGNSVFAHGFRSVLVAM